MQADLRLVRGTAAAVTTAAVAAAAADSPPGAALRGPQGRREEGQEQVQARENVQQ